VAALRHGNRLPGEGRLVDLQADRVHDARVGGHAITFPQAQEVPGDQLPRGDLAGLAVPDDDRRDRHRLRQRQTARTDLLLPSRTRRSGLRSQRWLRPRSSPIANETTAAPEGAPREGRRSGGGRCARSRPRGRGFRPDGLACQARASRPAARSLRVPRRPARGQRMGVRASCALLVPHPRRSPAPPASVGMPGAARISQVASVRARLLAHALLLAAIWGASTSSSRSRSTTCRPPLRRSSACSWRGLLAGYTAHRSAPTRARGARAAVPCPSSISTRRSR
jgi:hypothetical protein